MKVHQSIATLHELCRDCQVCTLGCSLYHEGECNPSQARLQVIKDMNSYAFNILICRHCEEPECVAACTVNALVLDSRGIVILLDNLCTRCGLCADECPYQAIYFSPSLNRYFKCDLCANRLAGPVCIELCPVEALKLMDFEFQDDKK